MRQNSQRFASYYDNFLQKAQLLQGAPNALCKCKMKKILGCSLYALFTLLILLLARRHSVGGPD